MDDVDRAQEINDLHLDIALSAQKAVSQGELGLSVLDCIDCGEEIPEARRTAVQGCLRCVDCQEKFENARRAA